MPAHTAHSQTTIARCVWEVAICVNALLICVFVSVCVSQDKDIEGEEEEEEEAATNVPKVNGATS